MTETKGTIAAFKAIPREKLATKVKKTVVGVGVCIISVMATAKFEAPWYVAVGGSLLGATIWSGEIVTAPLKLFGAVLVDLYKQVKGP